MKILVNFFSGVNEKSVNDMIHFVTQNIFAAENNKQIIDELVIQIASNGGSSDHGLLAYNYLKQLNIKKTTINIGNVDSAAVLIFCAGDQRYSMSTSRFTLHEAVTTLNGSFGGAKLREIADLNKRITEDYVKVISAVSGQGYKKMLKKIRQGFVIEAAESKVIGLTTDLLEKPYIESTNGVNALIITNQPTVSGQQQVVQP